MHDQRASEARERHARRRRARRERVAARDPRSAQIDYCMYELKFEIDPDCASPLEWPDPKTSEIFLGAAGWRTSPSSLVRWAVGKLRLGHQLFLEAMAAACTQTTARRRKQAVPEIMARIGFYGACDRGIY
eukprot:COSAG02_NODE_5342_length_4415_cov_3.398285_1_plen_130_part_10